MFGDETFVVRVADDGMAPRIAVGDFAWVDPHEPAVHGSVVLFGAGVGVVRLLKADAGRRVPVAVDRDIRPDIVLDADNETGLRGVVRFVGRRVGR